MNIRDDPKFKKWLIEPVEAAVSKIRDVLGLPEDSPERAFRMTPFEMDKRAKDLKQAIRDMKRTSAMFSELGSLIPGDRGYIYVWLSTGHVEMLPNYREMKPEHYGRPMVDTMYEDAPYGTVMGDMEVRINGEKNKVRWETMDPSSMDPRFKASLLLLGVQM